MRATRGFGVTIKNMIARGKQDTFAARVDHYRDRINDLLDRTLGNDDAKPERLLAAMQYSVLGPGKRIRPLLTYASAELCEVEAAAVDAIAAAVELVHAYSLVHDDLPAMDDDDLRRGRPTAHRAFDEATAILAGDALQALAFEILCTDPVLGASAQAQIRIVTWLARAVGPAGMVGGQALDLDAEGKQIDEAHLEDIHRRKTGELIRAAIMMPTELSRWSDARRASLDRFACEIGLVFQIRDDLLEVEQDTVELGKSAGSDSANAKSTYPSILGAEAARARADEIYGRALRALAETSAASDGLRWLSELILTRSN
jgi:geranylgeranyl diphosphate synthase, type II